MRGEDLTSEHLWLAYREGVFPMTTDEETGEVGWFEPIERAVFPLEGMHVSRSLRRTIRSGKYRVTFDTAFEAVMRGCFRPSGDNWLSEHFVRAYGQAHAEGWAHSAEAWQGDELVGGTYGVQVGTCFCAESMFHRATDAGKVALWAMIERCRDLGFTIFDIQMLTPHTASLGAVPVSQRTYRRRLSAALDREIAWPRPFESNP